MSADIVILRPLKPLDDPDEVTRIARRCADLAIHQAIQRHKWAYGEEFTLMRMKQIVAGMEFVNEVGRPTCVDN